MYRKRAHPRRRRVLYRRHGPVDLWHVLYGTVTRETYSSAERRPLASRRLPVAGRCATWLAARNVSPNAISVAGVGFSTLACLCLAGTGWTGGISARVLFGFAALFIQVRLLANLFDGMVAVESGKASPEGEIFNEVPDRISDPLIFVGIGFAAGGSATVGASRQHPHPFSRRDSHLCARRGRQIPLGYREAGGGDRDTGHSMLSGRGRQSLSERCRVSPTAPAASPYRYTSELSRLGAARHRRSSLDLRRATQ